MRTYLVDQDKNEVIIDLTKTIKRGSNLVEFHFQAVEDNNVVDKSIVYIRKLAGSFFYSEDQKSWRKLAKQKLPKKFLNVDRIFGVYRGYKPSGLTDGAEGELKTAMPGKVIKINVNEGDTVEQGDTLLILEAMKMENEIKASMSGKIKSILVKEGEALESGVLMIEIE